MFRRMLESIIEGFVKAFLMNAIQELREKVNAGDFGLPGEADDEAILAILDLVETQLLDRI